MEILSSMVANLNYKGECGNCFAMMICYAILLYGLNIKTSSHS